MVSALRLLRYRALSARKPGGEIMVLGRVTQADAALWPGLRNCGPFRPSVLVRCARKIGGVGWDGRVNGIIWAILSFA